MKGFSKRSPESAESGPIPGPSRRLWRIIYDGIGPGASWSSRALDSGKAIFPRCEAILLLVDTSVWIEVFKKPSRFDLRSVVDVDEVVTCLPIIQEVLQGFREENAFRLARDAMFSFPLIESPLRGEVFEEAAQLYRTARRAGITIRSGVDCLIAVCAMRHELAVLHADRDFSFLSQVSPLKQISV